MIGPGGWLFFNWRAFWLFSTGGFRSVQTLSFSALAAFHSRSPLPTAHATVSHGCHEGCELSGVELTIAIFVELLNGPRCHLSEIHLETTLPRTTLSLSSLAVCVLFTFARWLCGGIVGEQEQ